MESGASEPEENRTGTAAPGFQPGNGSPGRGEGDPVVAVHGSFRKGELVIGHDRVGSHIPRFHVLAGKRPAQILHRQVNVRVDDADRGPALGLLLPEDPLESFDTLAQLGGRLHTLSCSCFCSAGLSVRSAGVTGSMPSQERAPTKYQPAMTWMTTAQSLPAACRI